MSVRLFCIGDIHLGRRPTRVPSELLEHVGARDLGPAGAWRRAVEEALALEADAVLLAGDVVEDEKDFYEAYGLLEDGVRRLLGRGIAVLAVAGNHDVAVLPRLADSIEGFQLLGRRGTWETAVVRGRSGELVRVTGWSFPGASYDVSPLAAATFESGEVPAIGLLHCDRDGGTSPYAPVRSSELEAAPVVAWLLGHVHVPDPLSGRRPIGYLGSLCGLDPGEAGPRGPWLVEVDSAGSVRARHLPMAPVRWELVDVDVSGLENPGDLGPALVGAIDGLHERLLHQCHRRPLAVGCRFRLVGRSRLGRALSQAAQSDEIAGLIASRDEVVYFADKLTNESLPAVDLNELAKGTDPPALVARKLLVLERPVDDPERRRLLAAVREQLDGVTKDNRYALLADRATPSEEECAALARRVCVRALEELLAQVEEAS
ncbi:MAG: DNA repair exonuclease [Candidatus Dadabacteria bacterium]|nr:MAG: DNA repair exonuclease [Candidatus Dadabacteria bacterium]